MSRAVAVLCACISHWAVPLQLLADGECRALQLDLVAESTAISAAEKQGQWSQVRPHIFILNHS